jgi:pimeloyl-ACP methyl ester carboxylesterase
MKPSRSEHLTIRGLRYHLRHWGPADGRRIVLLHGWLDASASFQFVVDALQHDWHVIAPDWRGEGLTDWVPTGTYNMYECMADLDGILEAVHRDEPVNLIGHSRGGNIACLYAGIRPDRVRRLVNIEGFGLRQRGADEAPAHYAHWLEELRRPLKTRTYAGFDELAAQIRRHNPRLGPDHAAFLAQHWGVQREGGDVVLRADPAWNRPSPVLFRLEEMLACWRQVKAPALWIEATESANRQRHQIVPEDYEARRKALGTARTVTIPDAGHMVHLEQPLRLAREIEGFLLEA